MGTLVLDTEEPEDPPYVCPGCYAINGEPCAAYCPDAAIERDSEVYGEYPYDDDSPEDEEPDLQW